MRALYGLILTTRPRQWTKNVLFVFPAIVFSSQLFDLQSLGRVIICSILVTLTAGCIYIINDIADVEADRQHPTKKHRPIAAGMLPIPVARVAIAALALFVLVAALSFDLRLTILLLAYFLLQVAYSYYLKRIVLLDILAVATGFVMRILAGGIVIDVSLSPWLTTSAGLLALFLVIGKRRQELLLLGDQADIARAILQRYNLRLLDDMLRTVTTSVLITYIIYTVESPTMIKNGQNLGLLTVPIVIYGIFRYLYLIHVEEAGSAPDEVFLTDRPLQLAMVLAVVTYFTILYLL